MVKLSIIILSYNTKKVTRECLKSLFKNLKNINDFKTEIIVVDNGSKDGSVEMLEGYKVRKLIKLIKNEKNEGFAKANNRGLRKAKGEYILFLNSDVMVNEIRFGKLINYLERNLEVGAVTVEVRLPTGEIDPASHRGFPTPWNSFCYFSNLEKFFGKLPLIGRIFGGYHLTYLNRETVHEVDSITGAFFLTRRKLLEKLNGFDEDFFMYGEDIDLAFRIKKLGYKIIYYPLFQVTHLKYTSGLKKNNKETKKHFYKAMKIFYHKHYEKHYPWFFNKLIYLLIDFKSHF
ncbi:MAG: glycosyltransferase family 2 protein [Microgenomates group bacterium]